MPKESTNNNSEQLLQQFDFTILEKISPTPEQLLSQWSEVNQHFNETVKSESLWRDKLTLHFPFYPAENGLCPLVNFQNAYEKEYTGLASNHKAFFSAAKEGCLDLKEINIDDLLAIVDANDFSVLDWLVIQKQQALLNEIYENFFQRFIIYQQHLYANKLSNFRSYPLSLKSISIFRDPPKNNALHLIWAIKCQQPFATIQRIAPTVNDYLWLLIMLYETARLGNLDAVDYFFNRINYLKSNETREVFAAQLRFSLEEAAKWGHTDVVNFILNRVTFEGSWLMDKLIEQAVSRGHLPLVNSLSNKVDPAQLLLFAVRYGRVSIINELLGKQAFAESNITLALLEAASKGKIDVIQYICGWVNNKPTQKQLIAIIDDTCCHLSKTNLPEIWDCMLYLIGQLDFNALPAHETGFIKRRLNRGLSQAIQEKKWDAVKHVMPTFFNLGIITPGEIFNRFKDIEKKIVFESLCKNETNPLLKARSLLLSYAQGHFYKQKRALFWNNDPGPQAIELVKQIDNDTITRDEELMEKLAEIKCTGIFSQVKKYIEKEIYPHLAKSRKRKAGDDAETSVQEQNAKYPR